MKTKRSVRSKEHCRKIAIANTGKTHSQETKELLRKIVTGRKATDETRKLISKSKLGKPNAASRKVSVGTVGIDYREYDSIALAATGESCDHKSVRYRCDSESSRFSHWNWNSTFEFETNNKLKESK